MAIPLSTYRLQFTPAFDFTAAREVLDYLTALGVDAVYASPVFAAQPGSRHGYDVVDPNAVNPELGTREAFESLVRAARERGLCWVQDIVPNHMAFHPHNRMLMDILESGESSTYRPFFDVDWEHSNPALRGRLLAPILGRFYGEALEAGEIRLNRDRDGFFISYYDHRFPLAIETYDDVLEPGSGRLKQALGHDSPDWHKLLGVLYVLKTLRGVEDVGERGDQIRFVKELLAEMVAANDVIRAHVEGSIAALNGEPGRPQSFDRLDALLARQRFRLAFWKVATEEINYRRFFNINGLISVRVEDAEVYAHTHRLVHELVRAGLVTGLRVDHIDGLYDPQQYLARLRRDTGPDTWIVVEKILAPDEALPPDWPAHGTTGYEFMTRLTALLCDPQAERAFDRIYERFRPTREPYRTLVAERKRLIIGKEMAGDVDNLALHMKSVSGRSRHGSDITLYGLRRAIVEVLAWFPVYRTYITRDSFTPQDRGFVAEAIRLARREEPALRHELDFIEDFLLLRRLDAQPAAARDDWLRVALRFQQLSGPLMAKGFEDTVLYIYHRLVALNDVGGSPERFGLPPADFHDWVARRARDWPHALSSSQTHDAKRGEDVRARLAVLTEVPAEWGARVREWSRLNAAHRQQVGDGPAPDRNDEYFLYQTLVGAFPFYEGERPAFRERLAAYLVKAVREAKTHTAWLEPDEAYEQAFLSFAAALLRDGDDNPFLRDFLPFQRTIAWYGMWNSLTQTLLKVAAPGVPDFYRGTELWDLSLVDPDNRRPVDWPRRRRTLAYLDERAAAGVLSLLDELFSTAEDGRIKLFLTARALRARKAHPALFTDGDYRPLTATGPHAARTLAFARVHEGRWAIAAAPRFLTQVVPEGQRPVGPVWIGAALALPEGAPRRWTDTLTGQALEAAAGALPLDLLWRHLPGALLVSDAAPEAGE